MSRRRYRWDEERKELVEVGDDWTPTPRVEIQMGNHYEGLRATDGTPIDTRRKHAEYMKRNNLALVGEMQSQWAANQRESKRELAVSRREDIARAIHHATNRRSR